MSRLLSSRPLQILVGLIGVVLTSLLVFSGPLVELLWMSELDYEGVFWSIWGARVVLFLVMFVVALSFFGGNVYWLFKQIPPLWASQWTSEEGEPPKMGGKPITRERLRRLGLGGAAVVSLLFASGFSEQWDAFFRYASSQTYGMADPLYGIDVGFYLLQLPFIQTLQSAVVGLAFLGLLILVTVYVLIGEINVQQGQLRIRPAVVKHIGANVVVLLLGWTWGFYLDRFELLYSGGGTVFGAGYADVNVTLPALWLMIVATLGLATIVAYNLVRYNLRLLLYGIVLYVIMLVGGLIIAPSVVNQVIVEPNELEMEAPFLESNIEMTRAAYGLDDVQTRPYPAETELTRQSVEDNQDIIENVRLWDPRLLTDNYKQLQQIRLYYQFYNVDIDRYTIDGEYRQVMLGARELTQNLPAQSDTWYNRHLQYTHGYGSVVNLAAQEGEEGTPTFLLRDLPPEGEPELMVDEPAIYYGEQTGSYNLVNTRAEELNYPQGDENVYTNYKGDGGVLLDSFWKEVLFSWFMGDYNVLLSENLQEGSRIQFWNRVQERINKIAPFLRLDNDPYLVLSDQRQYWIQDAYTTARMFPYSETTGSPLRGDRLNYIRNSVKVVVDAYNGDVTFYVIDEDDPILGAYREAFPELFQPISAMSDNLQSHLRYPQDLFTIQIEKYARYHVTIPRVFYNNEDLWTRPNEQYAGRQRIMEPYYILTELPGEDKLEFMLMTPMTPDSRENMIAWIAGKSDQPNYGELVEYTLPKDKLIYGPNQIESRVDQNTDISRQLSLWDQRGSRVVRGNLIVVPIEESFLYVEPIYLIAQGVQIPQLRRVIVSYGEQVAMEQTLGQALNAVFGDRVVATAEGDAGEMPMPRPARQMQAEVVQDARDLFEQAQEALQGGDFATFGERFEELEELLQQDLGPTEPPADTTVVSSTPIGTD